MEKTAYRPRFGFDIRIKRGDEARKDTREHPCTVMGCEEEGVCNCPISPHNMSARQWLCTRHAREHNEHWDFFEGMSESEILQFQVDAITGHRPTWPMGKRAADDHGFARHAQSGTYSYEDGFVVFTGAERPKETRKPLKVLTPMQINAYEALGLETSASLNEVKARYKELVKRFHPDANGGERGAEERLRQVINAYGVLRATRLG